MTFSQHTLYRAACEIDHFQCYDFTGCIDNTLVCNGVEDCLNGKDEAQCGCT